MTITNGVYRPEVETEWESVELAAFERDHAAFHSVASVHRVSDCSQGVNTANTCEHCDSANTGSTANTVITAEQAVRNAIPQTELKGDREFVAAVFHLARHIKSVPSLTSRPGRDLRQWVELWHRLAGRFLPGRGFVDCWAEFASAWPAVRHAAGDDAVRHAWDRCQAHPADDSGYGDERIDRLIQLCRELDNGDGFYLSGRRVADLFGITQPIASKWFNMLVADGVLKVADPGGGFKSGRRMARSYRLAIGGRC